MSLVINRFSRSAAAITMLILFGSLCVSASALAQEGAQVSGPDLARGEELFGLCTQCHGSAGGGDQAALAPAIAGLPAWYIEVQLAKFKSGQRGLHAMDKGGLRMYPMSRWLREEGDIEAVSAYVASLPKPEITRTLTELGDAAKGLALYGVCSACHSPDGSGNQGMGAPPLAGMNDWYLLSSIQKYKQSVRGSLPGDTLGPMMIGMAATLPDDAAVLDVIAHIQTLEKQSLEKQE